MRRFEGVTLPRATRWIETDSDPTDQFSSIRWDGRADAINQLGKTVGDLIDVDGVMHQRSFEPYLSVVIGRMGVLPVKEIGIEAKERTRWNVGNKSHAMFPANDWDRAVEFALGDEPPSAAVDAEFARVRPRILIPESICYDWKLSFQAASKINGTIKHMVALLIPKDPRLVAAVESMDVDEQHEILTSIDEATVNSWKAKGVLTTPYWEALEILDERPISVGIPSAPLRRP